MKQHDKDGFAGVAMKTRLLLFVIGVIVVGLIGAGGWHAYSNRAYQPSSSPTSSMMTPSSGITTFNSYAESGLSQADVGAKIYGDWCITCHGDKGQGLTAAWRATWDPAHQNCWQSKCHSLNHPPGGFQIPRYVPAIVGPTTLTDFKTAADLHDFVSHKMPFQDPGVLDQDAYWALTAYLLQQNGLDQIGAQVNLDNAGSILIQR
jgi:cytochrome c5